MGCLLSESIELCAVGDVIVNRENPVSILEPALPILRGADVSFGNCESTYSTTGVRNPHARGEVRGDPRNVEALAAGFNVMSFANNHHLDSGEPAFFETLRLLHDAGIATCGAGADITQARRPAVIERKGVRVAFLACTAILFPDYDATPTKAGAVPLRTTTEYQQVEMEQPGSPPRIVTRADPADLANLVDDVVKAREIADIVIVSPHWGLHFTPGAVADYETEVGRAAIDAGADIILGHHQHILKPIQVYKGKAIVHGMGNFAMDVDIRHHEGSASLREMISRYPGLAVGFRPDYPTYPFHPDSRRTVIVKCRLTKSGITRLSFVPCYINPSGQPVPVSRNSHRFAEVADYMRDITAAAGFDVGLSDADTDVEVLT